MTPGDQCKRRKRIGQKTVERCLRRAGHTGLHVFASSPPLTTFLRLIDLIDAPAKPGGTGEAP